jgi:hypothetical protein
MGKFTERYATNKVAEEQGQWVDFGDGIKVKLRRLNSEASREFRRKLEKPYEGQYRTRPMPDSLNEELLIKQLAGCIVVDWEGVENPDNEKEFLPFSPENVTRMVTLFKDFREDITTASMTQATFQGELVEQNKGN